MSRARIAKVSKITAAVVICVVALVVVAVLAASIFLQGPRLAKLIDGFLPEFRGKIKVGGVNWKLRIIPDLLRGTPSPISADGVLIIDPDGTPVVEVAHLTASVEVHFSPMKIIIHDLKPGTAMWRFGRMKSGQEGIGFTAALETKDTPPVDQVIKKEEAPSAGFLFQIASAQLDGLTAIFDFAGWGLELRNLKGDASLIMTSLDPRKPFFGFDAKNLDARGGGYLRILEEPANILPFDRVTVARVATTPEWPDAIFLDLTGGYTGKSVLRGKGFFTGIYEADSKPGIEIHASFEEAADALSAVAAGHKIEGLTVGGAGAKMTAHLKDEFEVMKVDATFEKLDVGFAENRALGIGFKFAFDAGTMKIGLRDFGFTAPGGGRFGMDLDLDALDGANLKMATDLKLDRFTTDSYLPKGMKTLAAGKVTGKLHAEMQTGAMKGKLRGVDIAIARSRGGGLPRRIRLRGEASGSPEKVVTSGLTVEIPGASATAKGEVALARQIVHMGLTVAASDLGRVLKTVGAPPLAKQAQVSVDIDGSFKNPTATGEATVNGVGTPDFALSTIDANFSLEDGTARLESLSGPAFGGTLAASGELQLYRGTTARMLKQPVVSFQLDGKDIDLEALLHNPALGGRISFQTTAKGPLDKLALTVRMPPGAKVRILDEEYEIGSVEAEMEGQEITIKTAHIARAEGGTVDLQGKVTLGGPLSLDVEIAKLPLAGLPILAEALAEAKVDLTGTFSASLHVGGRFADAPGAPLPVEPELSGEIRLHDVVARGVAMGDALITLSPGPHGAVVAKGDLFKRFHLEAQVAMGAAGPAIGGHLSFEKLILEDLAPELVSVADGKGIVSGKITVDLRPGSPMSIDARLTELALSVAREIEDDFGEISIRRVEVKNANDLHATVVGDRIVLDPWRLVTTGGELVIAGRLDGKAITGDVDGHLDLELAQPFLRTTLEKLTGDVDLTLRASGTTDLPAIRGTVKIAHAVKLRPVGFESDITIPSGTIELRNDHLKIDGLAITVDDATVRLDGKADLTRDFQPKQFDLRAAGQVSARLLESLAPDAISDAIGRAKIDARISGTPERPKVKAQIDLGLIDFRLRDMGREVQIQSGVVEIDNDGATLTGVRARIDDQGLVIIGASGVRPGIVEFESLQPFRIGDIDLPLHGEQINHRVPGSVEIDDLAFDFALTGDPDDALSLKGDLRLVSGKYVQDFKVQDLVLSPRINESSVRPAWEGNSVIENLALDLRVRTIGDGFVVQNNLAPEIHLDIDVRVGGTIAEQRLGGHVRLLDGRFHIPGLRGDFDLVPGVGHAVFGETKSLADGETPELLIEATNHVIDVAGNEHNVRLRIQGPIGEMAIDLSSDEGLDRGEVAVLLISGRTTEDRFATQNATPGANIATGTDLAGQLTRDTVGNLLEPYVDDTMFRLTGINLVPTVGPDGAELKVRKRFSRETNIQANALWGFQNQRRYSLEWTIGLVDYLSLNLLGLRTISVPQGLVETQNTLNLELTLEFPIRF